MFESKKNGYYKVDYDGRTWLVDPKGLLNDPKVKKTMERMSKANEKYRGQPGVTFLRPVKSQS